MFSYIKSMKTVTMIINSYNSVLYAKKLLDIAIDDVEFTESVDGLRTMTIYCEDNEAAYVKKFVEDISVEMVIQKN